MNTKNSICLLGGHLSPAQAVAETLRSIHPDIPITFIARKQSFITENYESVESTVMKKFGHVITINPPRRLFPWNWPAFAISVLTIFYLFSVNRPRAVVSFGSYVSIPAIIVTWILRIPLIIHEQTRSISRSNQFASRFARIVCVNDEQVDVSHIKTQVVVTGFPLRPSLFEQGLGSPYPIPSGMPIVLITGGTTGAVSINELVFPIIDSLVKHCVIVHQTGSVSYKKALGFREQLDGSLIDRYIVAPFSSSETMSWLYKNATVAVSRSGANTIYELLAFRLPAILIPLPWSQNNEQEALAHWFCRQQKGIVLDQHSLTSQLLQTKIEELISTSLIKDSIVAIEQGYGSRKLVDAIVTCGGL